MYKKEENTKFLKQLIKSEFFKGKEFTLGTQLSSSGHFVSLHGLAQGNDGSEYFIVSDPYGDATKGYDTTNNFYKSGKFNLYPSDKMTIKYKVGKGETERTVTKTNTCFINTIYIKYQVYLDDNSEKRTKEINMEKAKLASIAKDAGSGMTKMIFIHGNK